MQHTSDTQSPSRRRVSAGMMLTMALAALTQVSCSTQRFYLTQESRAEQSVPILENRSSFFLGGLAQEDRIDAARLCAPEKVAMVEHSFGVLDWLLGAFTFGLYTPRSYEVHCEDVS